MSAAVEIITPRSAGPRVIEPPRTVYAAALFVPVTDEARASIAGAVCVRMDAFPFRIGRESRASNALTRAVVNVERRLSAAPPLNELYLIEPAAAHVHISRKHCAIDRAGASFVLLDRNSMCGAAIVRSVASPGGEGPFVDRIGAGTPTDRAPLHDGDLIVLGTEDSPYVFRFEILRSNS